MRLGRKADAASKPGSSAAEPAAQAPAALTEAATHTLLATVALRAGNALIKRSMERGILGRAPGVVKAAASAAVGIKPPKSAAPKRSLAAKLAMAAATRIATRSVPGAIVVGGAMLAKTLYDRKRSKKP